MSGTLFERACALMLIGWLGAAHAADSDDEKFDPVQFDPRPPSAELVPRNDDEQDASVLVLRYSVEHRARIVNLGKGTTTERHRARYLVRDSNGVASLKEHTFFGDETNVIVADVQGQTVSPDGSVHPVDPDKDIRKLDVERAGDDDDLLRTVNFPRVEPGAILDLAWTSTRRALPSFEMVDLEARYPIRELDVKVRGRLIGQGKSIWLGSGQYYWVPFFTSRVPDDIKVRMSSAFDLELSARNLKSFQSEPASPPAVRTAALLGVMPLSFHIGDWKEHMHLFRDAQSLADVKPGKRVWFDTTMNSADRLAEIDELGLQKLPLANEDAQREGFKPLFNYFDTSYKTFIRRSKSGAKASALNAIAPAELPVVERVERILRYAADTVEYRSVKKPVRFLDQLKKRGYGSGSNLVNYSRYLLETAGIDVDLVWISNRQAPLLVPPLEDSDFYDGIVMLEVSLPDGQHLYLQPNMRFATKVGLPPKYLGGVLFRRDGGRWSVDRVDLDTLSEDGLNLTATSSVADGKTAVQTEVTINGDDRNFFFNTYYWNEVARGDKPRENGMTQEQAQKRAERGNSVLRKLLTTLLGEEMDEELELTPPAVTNLGRDPLPWIQQAEWEPEHDDIGDGLLVRLLPDIGLFNNVFVADEREQPIWLPKGAWAYTMKWQLGDEFAAPELPSVRSATGPGGLGFRMVPGWDAQTRILSTHIEITRPAMLPASDYAAVKSFFVELQKSTGTTVLLRRN